MPRRLLAFVDVARRLVMSWSFDLPYLPNHQGLARWAGAWLLIGILGAVSGARAGQVRIVSFNVENYVEAQDNRPTKTERGRNAVLESVVELKPDILGLQEMGSTNVLLQLQTSLKKKGLNLPHWEWIEGPDTNIHVAVLSRFPIIQRRPHLKDRYVLQGRPHAVSRGILEVEVEVQGKPLTILNAHLKSRRVSTIGNQEEMRLQEALILRSKIEQAMARPNSRLVVLGDFNDTPNSEAVKAILGKGKEKLTDVRPTEKNGPLPAAEPGAFPVRQVAWTHFYAQEDAYTRVDYILVSKNLARGINREETKILHRPNWGEASDHRPIVAVIEME